MLSNSAESFVERLLGRPNEKLSSAYEWRYGNKGSLVINMSGEKRGLWHNFETGESGNLLTLLQKETGLSFRESLKYSSDMFGNKSHLNISKQNNLDKRSLGSNDLNGKLQNKQSKTKEYAQKLVSESMPIAGTIAERYLKEVRGINSMDSSDIRYHPKVYIGKNEKTKGQEYLPAMVAIGRNKDGNIQCVQATYLDPKTANKADIGIKKRTYSSPSGASVLLQQYEGSIENSLRKSNKNINGTQNKDKNKTNFIAEGVETGLSIKDAIKNDKNNKSNEVIVTLGKSNFINIDPGSVGQKVVFCLDNDGPKSFVDNAIHKAAERLVGFGKNVFIAIPNRTDQMDGLKNTKMDFNDLVCMKGIGVVKEHLDNAISYKQFSKSFGVEDKNLNSSTADKITRSNFSATKQSGNLFQKNENIKSNIANEISKNMEQSQVVQYDQKSPGLQIGKMPDLDFEI